jgi:hypothetical protein
MNQTNFERKPFAAFAALPDLGGVTGALDPDAMLAAWARALKANTETLRSIHQHNAEFAGRLLDLQVKAVESFGATDALATCAAKPLELGASALALWMSYLSESAALAQQAVGRSWGAVKP